MSKEKVLIVCDYFWPSVGGLEVVTENLGAELMKNNFDVDIVTSSLPNRTEAVHRGMKILSIKRSRIPLWDRWNSIPQAVKIISSGRYGACILMADPLNWVLWTLEDMNPLSGTRIIVQPLINEDGYKKWKDNPPFRERLVKVLKRADAVLSLTRSGADARFFREEGIAHLYLPNAVRKLDDEMNFRSSSNVPPACPLLLHVANLLPVKNHLALIDTVKKIPGEWRLAVIGNPMGHDNYTSAVRAKVGSDHRILLLEGFGPAQVAAAMKEADLLLLASLGEVFPVSILEAMSHGKPWISTPACGAVHDLAGGIVAPLEEFPGWLRILMSNPVYRLRMGETGERHWKECFSWGIVGTAWVSLVRDGGFNQDFGIPESVALKLEMVRKDLRREYAGLEN